ncbi:hypothetical protein V6Z11_A07G261700 [Gossypium hirsutum]
MKIIVSFLWGHKEGQSKISLYNCVRIFSLEKKVSLKVMKKIIQLGIFFLWKRSEGLTKGASVSWKVGCPAKLEGR